MSLWLLFATSQEKIGDNIGFYLGENPKSGVSSLGTRVCWLLRGWVSCRAEKEKWEGTEKISFGPVIGHCQGGAKEKK